MSPESLRASAPAVRLLTETEEYVPRHAVRTEPFGRRVRVVTIGGGTGLSVLLQGLRTALFPSRSRRSAERNRDRLTAVVTVADDGGSSGRLRRAYGMIPPGDIRKCLLALSDGDPTLAAIFNFRFNGHEVREVDSHQVA